MSRAERPKKERCLAPAVAAITGLPLRTVQELSAKGKIPTAAKIGSRWTYHEATVRRWIKEREIEACRKTSIGAATSGGAESRFEATKFDEAYERLFSPSPRSGATS